MRRKYSKGLYGIFAAILLSGCMGDAPAAETVPTKQAEDYKEPSAKEQDEKDGDSTQTDSNSVPSEEVFTSLPGENGFFLNAKITREQMRAENKELLMSIVSDSAVADELKQQAIDEIIALMLRAECENVVEILLETMGYSEVVVSLLENEVDVTINVESITEQQIAEIEDIVSRKTGIGIDGIVITTLLGESNKGDSIQRDNNGIFTDIMLENGFFLNAKITTEQMRAENKELLMSIVSDSAVADELKQQAIDEIIAMTARAECENAAEILLEARGYGGVIVMLGETEVDVIVNMVSITEQQIAQIEDIVTRKTGISVDGIVITTVVMEDAKDDTAFSRYGTYRAGVYTCSIDLNDTVLNIEVVLNRDHIDSVHFTNLEDSMATMYPLLESALGALEEQLINGVPPEDVVLSKDMKYTQMLLMEKINATLAKASIE